MRFAGRLFEIQGGAIGHKSFQSLDGLRGYMAWWVVVGHFIQFSGFVNAVPAWVVSGDWAVNVFVILSGFVITHLVLEQREPFWPYIKRRAFRIVPIYWFALLAALLTSNMYEFTFVSPWVGDMQMRVDRIASTDANFTAHLLLHVGLLHGLVPDPVLAYSSSAILAPAWSLALEWQFYLVAPSLVLVLAKRGVNRIVAICGWLIVAAALKLYPEKLWQYPAFLPLSIHFFFLGILSRVALVEIRQMKNWVVPLAALLVFILPARFSVPILLWSMFLYAAVLEWGGEGGRNILYVRVLEVVARNRYVIWLGRASYSTYLIHIPLIVVVAYLLRLYSGAWSQEIAAASAVVAFFVLIPLSQILFRFVEMPFIRLGGVKRLEPATLPA